MTDSQPDSGPAIEDFDKARSEQYRFLARLLAAPPSAEALNHIAQLQGDDSALGRAFANLAQAAQGADAKRVEREFFRIVRGRRAGRVVALCQLLSDRLFERTPRWPICAAIWLHWAWRALKGGTNPKTISPYC